MTFKMGETCDGCDAIVKNLKKISESNAKHNPKALEKQPVGVKGMQNYMEDAVEDITESTKKVAKNVKGESKYTGQTVKYRKRK
jgi:hypothetical protein